jgi:hypothetical protein
VEISPDRELLDDLVGVGGERHRHVDAKRAGGLARAFIDNA